MTIINFCHYFIVNLLGFNLLPMVITYNGLEWFNVLVAEDNGWHLCYSRFIGKTETEDLFEVVHKNRYCAFLKMVFLLWKNRKKVDFMIDNY